MVKNTKSYALMSPGVSLIGDDGINTPCYPFRYEKPKVGDKVWVIVCNDEDLAIDTDVIREVSDFYIDAVNTFNYRKSILEDPTYKGDKADIDPGKEPKDSSNYLINFWLAKYRNGHANCFGETIYSSFEEARSVLVQFFIEDHITYNEVLTMTEEQLKPGASK